MLHQMQFPSLGHGPAAYMHGLAMSMGANAPGTVGERDKFERGCHSTIRRVSFFDCHAFDDRHEAYDVILVKGINTIHGNPDPDLHRIFSGKYQPLTVNYDYDDDEQIDIPDRAPVMVLPQAVLFPHAFMPLYIFEPRYRQMLAWALEHDRMFCIAQVRIGVVEAISTEDFHEVVGVGLIRACVGREDGTSHLVLQGLQRVQLTGFTQEAPFRIAEIEPLENLETESDETQHLAAQAVALCGELRERGMPLPETFDSELAKITDPGKLCDLLAHTLVADPISRQTMLEELSVERRIRTLIRAVRSAMG